MQDAKKIPIPIGDEEIVYQGKIIEVVRQKMKVGDKEKVFEIARRSPGVRLIIPVQGDKLLLTREYRTELGSWDYRLPGGKVIDKLENYNQFLKSGQDILVKTRQAVGREGREEVGIQVEKARHFLTAKSGGPTVEWDLYYFVVEKYSAHQDGQRLEAGENIETIEMGLDEVKGICLSGKMKEERSVAVLLKYLHSKGEF